MNTKLKGQGNMGLAQTIVVVAVALIVSVYVFATLSPSLSNQVYTNESIGTLNDSSSATTKCITYVPVLRDSETVYNSTYISSTQNTLTKGTDYSIDYSTGCVTNISADNRQVSVTYTHAVLGQDLGSGQTAVNTISTNTFTAFTLGAIVIIVIAAAAILRNLGLFG